MVPLRRGVSILIRPPWAITVSLALVALGWSGPPGGLGIVLVVSRVSPVLAGEGILLVCVGLGGWFFGVCSVFSPVPGGGAGRVSLKKKSETRRMATESTTANIRLRFSIMICFNLLKARMLIHVGGVG